MGQVQRGFKDGGQLCGQELVEGASIVGVKPVLPSPVIALWSTGGG